MKSTVSHICVSQVRPTTATDQQLYSVYTNCIVAVILSVCVRVCVLSGCKLGEASEFLVQQDARIQVPTRTAPSGCYEVCTCGPSGRLENCVEMPCVDTEKPCIIGGQKKSKISPLEVLDMSICSMLYRFINAAVKIWRIFFIKMSLKSLACESLWWWWWRSGHCWGTRIPQSASFHWIISFDSLFSSRGKFNLTTMINLYHLN